MFAYYQALNLERYYYDNMNPFAGWIFRPNSTVMGSGSSAFATQIREDTDSVRKLVTVYISDEMVESGKAFEAEETRIRKAFADDLERKKLQHKKNIIDSMHPYNEETEIFEYPNSKVHVLSNFTYSMQIAADNSNNGITTVDGIDYYKGYPLDAIEIDDKGLEEKQESNLNKEIMIARSNFKSDYAKIKKHLGSLKNYHYYLKDKQTGQIHTNMKNIENLKFSDEDYGASIINGEIKFSAFLRNVLNENEDLPWYYDENKEPRYLYGAESYYTYCFGSLDENRYDIYIQVNANEKSIVEGDVYSKLYNQWAQSKGDFKKNITIFLTALTTWILSLTVLVAIAGIKEKEGVKSARIDKIPNSIHFLISGFACAVFAILPLYIYEYFFGWDFLPTYNIGIASIPANLILIEWLMSVSREVKNKNYFKNTITYKLFIKRISSIRAWITSGVSKLTHKSIKRKIFMVVTFYIILNAIIVAFMAVYYHVTPYYDEIGYNTCIGFVLLNSIFAILYVRKISGALDNVLSALTKAEQGDFDFELQTQYMPSAIRPLAEKTNNLTDGLEVAINDAVHSERMKAELITNVSHDLKTPLTSIVTYTDLLKQCKIEDETARDYINVLDEKAERLKNLIDDLVEASKVSSGNIILVMAEIDLNEFVGQIFGEYEESFKALGLDLKYNVPEKSSVVVADGQKTYRIIENLFSNVEKYAMPKTRVYLDLTTDERFATLTMKNVSRDEMNFNLEMLSERFVRGDAARSSEGSGLGLSIAKSLAELQGGKFTIDIDGDLFKVAVSLPLKP